MDNRPRLVKKDNADIFYPISIFADLRETLELMELGGSNVRPYLAEWYNNFFLPTFEGEEGRIRMRIENPGEKNEKTLEEDYVAVTSKQLCEITNVSNEALRHKYIDPLVNQGIINKARSNIRKNENIYWPADSKGQNIFSLFKNEDFRLRVKDPRRYPSKTFVIDSFKQTGIFGEMFGDNGGSIFKKNILNIYRLEDENGLEITLEELAERYFSDPQTCFIEAYDKREAINGIDYTKMLLLNSILPRSIIAEKIEKNTPALVAEDPAEHFSTKSNSADSGAMGGLHN
jgi:hypothetical protein